MKVKQYKYMIFSAAILAAVGISVLFLNAQEKEIPTDIITTTSSNLADWQTGSIKTFEIIYKSVSNNHIVQSSEKNLLTQETREENFKDTHYNVLYTINHDDTFIDVALDTQRQKIKIKGLNSGENVNLELNGMTWSNVPADWAGRIELSINNQNTSEICLSFADSNIGFCHHLIKNNEVIG